jgi:hypothetical protein
LVYHEQKLGAREKNAEENILTKGKITKVAWRKQIIKN